MQRHYAGLAKRMLLDIESISDRMSHAGEKGRNNEAILSEFLRLRLPSRYTVSTGKVVATGGAESAQVDIIVHDRFENPAFIDSHAWSLVPIESVYAVISVKTTLTKSELRDAMACLASVRSLPRHAASLPVAGRLVPVVNEHVLRPRALVFAFKSGWASVDALKKAFSESLREVSDDDRPNGVCLLEQAFLMRRPYTTDIVPFVEHSLLHFFLFLVKTMDARPRYRTDLSKYFSEDYG